MELLSCSWNCGVVHGAFFYRFIQPNLRDDTSNGNGNIGYGTLNPDLSGRRVPTT